MACSPAMLERDTLVWVRRLEVSIAWPTVLLTLVLLASYAAVIQAASAGAMPYWLAMLLNAFVAYAAYTPLHEASHGNVARRRRAWLNRIVGIAGASLLLHNFTMHRTTHLAHHRHLNDPAKDADHWVAGQAWWSILLRCMTLVFSHYVMGVRMNGRRVIFTAMIENMLPLVALVAIGLLAGWDVMLWTMVAPALLGSTLLGLLFDYAVHAPYTGSGRFGATRMFLFPSGLGRLWSALWLAQNYHLIHHLYPWLPFYHYGEGYRLAAPLLAARSATIITLGQSRMSARSTPLSEELPSLSNASILSRARS